MTIGRLGAVLLATALAITAPSMPPARAQAPAAAPQDPVLSKLAGRWEGTGTILGQPAQVRMEWTAVLGDRFARLAFESHIGEPPRARRFEGHAYYRAAADGRLVATWFDSTGQIRPIEAVRVADAIVSTWGTPETEVGETTYRLLADDRVELVDRVRSRDGAWREFGRSQLTRVR